MISLMLRSLRWRILLLAAVAVLMFFLEPGFHQHEEFDPAAVSLGPMGVSASLSYLAGIGMILLFGGTISTDRREGYSRILFSTPTSPLAYYGLKWLICYVIAFLAAFLFLVVGQMVAWGGVLGGFPGLVLPALSALIYGGLVAFFSALLPKNDGWMAFLLFLPTLLPQFLSLFLRSAGPAIRQIVTIILPPQTALQDIWMGLLMQSVGWGAIGFAVAYGMSLLVAAGLIVKLREWP